MLRLAMTVGGEKTPVGFLNLRGCWAGEDPRRKCLGLGGSRRERAWEQRLGILGLGIEAGIPWRDRWTGVMGGEAAVEIRDGGIAECLRNRRLVGGWS